jgi:membrane protein required for colicin V production
VVVLVAAFFLIGHVALHLLLRRTPLEGRARLADRVGGGVFGLARGLALVGLAYLGYSYYLDETQQPEFVKSAVTRPIASGVAHWFETFAPETAHIEGAAVPSAEENAAVQGYNRGDRNGLQEIVTTVTTTDPAAQDSGAEPAPSQEDAEKDDIADILSEDDN